MDLELLYIDGCSSWHQTLENLRQALRLEGVSLRVSLVRVVGARHAKSLGLQGCPSIRVGGRDLLPEVTDISGLVCKLYRAFEGLSGCPTVQMIRQQIRALGVIRNPTVLGSVTEASPAL